ncbi:MAG: pelota-like protein [Acidilobaceae archaeon]
MKVLEADAKRRVLKLRVEYEEDLWTLKFTLRPKDLVSCWTTRDVAIGQSKERKPMIVKLKIEKMEFQPFTGALRISGVIVEGPEDYGVIGKHHTVSIKPGDTIVVEREEGWSERELKRFVESGYKGSVIIMSADYDEYAIALLTGLGLRVLEEGYSKLPGKGDEKREEAVERYVNELVVKISETVSKHKALVVVIGGPGPLKETIAEKLRKIAPDKRVYIDETASGGISGVNEILRRASTLEALKEFAVIEAEEVLEEIMSLVARDPERVAYGVPDVLTCAKAGAVEKIVIVDSLLSSLNESEREAAQKIMDEVEKRKAKVVIVPRDSPPGEKVFLLGGVVAKLRFGLPLDVRKEFRDI